MPQSWLVFAAGASTDRNDDAIERIDSLSLRGSGERYYAAVINRDSNYIRINNESPPPDLDTPPAVPVPPPAPPPAGAPAAPVTATLTGGTNGTAALDYTTAPQAALTPITDVNILVVPNASQSDAISWIGYAEQRKDLFYIVDPPKPSAVQDTSAQITAAKAFFNALTPKSSYAAFYFPQLDVPDPWATLKGVTRRAPPSGMLAGLYARTDNTRGVWKAPAGVEASLLGAIDVAARVTDADQDSLNPIGINCIRQFPGSGIVVWGARTLSTQSNPEYRYVPVRRMTNFLKASLFQGTQWVVFEPNDEPLWSAIRFNIRAFMLSLFRAGALQGGKPSEAFTVQCDADNNIQATIDAGQVHILVAFAPLKPAEFVIIHIQQIRKQ